MSKINVRGGLLILWILLAIWTTIGCKSKNISRTPTSSPSPQVQPTIADQPKPTTNPSHYSDDEEEDTKIRRRDFSAFRGVIFFRTHSDPAERDKFLETEDLSLEDLNLIRKRDDLTDRQAKFIDQRIVEILNPTGDEEEQGEEEITHLGEEEDHPVSDPPEEEWNPGVTQPTIDRSPTEPPILGDIFIQTEPPKTFFSMYHSTGSIAIDIKPEENDVFSRFKRLRAPNERRTFLVKCSVEELYEMLNHIRGEDQQFFDQYECDFITKQTALLTYRAGIETQLQTPPSVIISDFMMLKANSTHKDVLEWLLNSELSEYHLRSLLYVQALDLDFSQIIHLKICLLTDRMEMHERVKDFFRQEGIERQQEYLVAALNDPVHEIVLKQLWNISSQLEDGLVTTLMSHKRKIRCSS